MTRNTLTTATASAALIVALGASTAFAGDMTHSFATLDSNVDGQVTLDEFTAVLTADGSMSETAAAEKFTEISNGNDFFTEADFDAAMAWDHDADTGEPYVVEQPNEEVLDSVTKSTTETEIDVQDDSLEITEDTTTVIDTDITEPDETSYSSDAETGALTDAESDTDASVAPEPGNTPDLGVNPVEDTDAEMESETEITSEIDIPEAPEVPEDADPLE